MAARLADGTCGPGAVRVASGGIGSLNDLVIDLVNGHAISVESINSGNQELDAARPRIYAHTHE